MSSYNRIPKDSVSFSKGAYRLEYLKDTINSVEEVDVIETELEREERMEEEKRNSWEYKLTEKEKELLELENSLEEKQRRLNDEKEIMINEFDEKIREIKKNARKNHFNLREFAWDQALLMAEEILNQKIESNTLSIEKIFDRTFRSLPVAFDELEITVHPDTLERLKSETQKEQWVLKEVAWKYDYSLKVGEFIIEEESEYYDNRFSAIFEEVRKKLTEKNIEMRRDEDDVDQ